MRNKGKPQHILEIGIHVNRRPRIRYPHGNTKLHLAVIVGDATTANMLIYKGDNVRTQNIFGDTPLHDAVKRQQRDIIEQLVSNGAPLDFQNNKGETVLHIACLHCDKTVVKLLLRNNADCNALTIDGSTPLHYAVRNVENSADIVPLLIKAGAGALVMNSAREVPFTIAIKQRIEWYSCEFLGYLLGKGLKLNRPVNKLCRNLFDDIDNIMLPALSVVFTIAIKCKDKPLFKLLIRKGIPINDRNQFGTTPLLEAVTSNNMFAAKVLLKLGADPNCKDSHNKSALRLANNKKMIKLLLVYNADVYEANLLHRIVSKKTYNFMFARLTEKVLDNKAKKEWLNKMCSRGYSVLHYAVETENYFMLAQVLYAGVESKEFFKIFLKTSKHPTDLTCWYLMTMQAMIFHFQGITNEQIMRIIRSDRHLGIYDMIMEDQEKMAVTRICENFPFTYYDLLMKRGEELVRILRNEHIRKTIVKLKTDPHPQFVTFHRLLELNVKHGLRRLRLKSKFVEALRPLKLFDIACHMSKYFSNTDLLKVALALKGPKK